MGLLDSIKKFARPDTKGAVTDGSAQGAKVGLFTEQSFDQMLGTLMRIPDPDEVLRKAGVPRHRLRALFTDDAIESAFGTRLDAVSAVPIRLESTDGSPDVEFLEEELDPWLESLISGAWQALPFGYSVIEVVYKERDDGRIGIAWLGEKPMEWFEPRSNGTLRLQNANNKDGGGFGSPGAGNNGNSTEVDTKYKYFVTKVGATYRNPYGRALLSRLYWPWFFRTNGWKFWGKFLERFASPMMVGKSGNTQAMLQALLMAQNQAVLSIDKTDDVTAIGTSGNKGEAFDLFEVSLCRRIDKLVLGQTLTTGTDGGSGNRALGQVHENVRMDKRTADIVMVRRTLQHVVNALCELNGIEEIPEVVMADEKGLEADRSRRDETLGKLGVKFTKNYFMDNYGLRDDEIEVSEPTAQSNDPNVVPVDPTASALGPDGKPIPLDANQQRRKFARHAATSRFTAHQQRIEGLADDLLDRSAMPLDPEEIRSAVLSASDPEDLEQRLFALIGDRVNQSEFASTLESAMYAADVIGYVQGTGAKA